MVAPNSIILDTRTMLHNLRYLAHNVNEIQGRVFINDLIEDLVTAISFAPQAEHRLNALAQEIADGEYEYGYTILNPELAAPMYYLGISMYEQLRHWKIYMPDGSLRYQHYRIDDPAFNDIVLTRIHELTQHSGASNTRPNYTPAVSSYPRPFSI